METIYNRGINLGYRENKSDRQIVLMTRRNAPCGGRSLSGFAFLFQQLTPGVRSVYFDSTTAGEIAVSDTIPRMSQMRENSDAFGLGFCARVIALRLEFVSCADSRTRRRSKLRLLSARMKHPRSTDAYIYGYPLVTMEYTRRILSNRAEPTQNGGIDGAIGEVASVPRSFVSLSYRSKCGLPMYLA
jgi:hypothetical protein